MASRNPLVTATALAATAAMAFIPACIAAALSIRTVVTRFDGADEVTALLAILFGVWLIVWLVLNRIVFKG